MKRGSALIAGVVVLTVLALTVRAFGEPMPLDRLDALRFGMTPAEVRHLLGEPTSVHAPFDYVIDGHRYSSGREWSYYRTLVFGFVNVHFATDGTYVSHGYERY